VDIDMPYRNPDCDCDCLVAQRLLALDCIDTLALSRIGELAARADPRLAEELALALPELPSLLRGVQAEIFGRRGSTLPPGVEPPRPTVPARPIRRAKGET